MAIDTRESTPHFSSKKSPAQRIFQNLKNVGAGCLMVGAAIITSPVWVTLLVASGIRGVWRGIRFRWWLHSLKAKGFIFASQHPAWDEWVEQTAKTYRLKVLYREDAYRWSKAEHELVRLHVPQADRPQANWWRARRAFPVVVYSSKFFWLSVWNGVHAWRKVFSGDADMLATEESRLAKQLG